MRLPGGKLACETRRLAPESRLTCVRRGDDRTGHCCRYTIAHLPLTPIYKAKNVHGGLTIPATGTGGAFIVKLPSQTYRQVPENEFSMMTLAKRIGINVPAIDLRLAIANLPDGLDALGAKAFVIERFDRLPDGSLIHIEDFAQVFDVYADDRYKAANMRSIARVVAAESDDDDIAELVRRMTFTPLIGNGDMHLKNWSLIYPDCKNAALAPAYDFVSTIPYVNRRRTLTPDRRAILTPSPRVDVAGRALRSCAHAPQLRSRPAARRRLQCHVGVLRIRRGA